MLLVERRQSSGRTQGWLPSADSVEENTMNERNHTMPADTANRVQEHTRTSIDARVQKEMQERLRYYAGPGKAQIDQRLSELERESDIERAIEVEAPIMMLTGIALGARVHKLFFVLPVAAAGMVILHSLHGWYPLIPVLRRLGFRTTREINDERHELLFLKEQCHAA
jgi:hypothetical protein